MRRTQPTTHHMPVFDLRVNARVLALMLCWPAFAWAQEPATPSLSPSLPAAPQAAGSVVAQVQSLDRFEAEQERLRQRMKDQPAGYEDKFFSNEAVQFIDAQVQAIESQPLGVRSIVVESRLESTRQSYASEPVSSETGLGLRLEYRHETMNHGEWVLQADARQRSSQDTNVGAIGAYSLATDARTGQRVTLRNLSFPVTPFVLADTSVGDITSEVTDGLTRGQQFSLGNSTARGISAHAFSREFDARVGIGSRGQLAGGPYPGYEATQGDIAWLGYTRRFSEKSYAAVQLNHANATPVLFSTSSNGNASNETNTSAAAAIGYGYNLDNDGDKRVRLTLIRSQTQANGGAASRSANGAYLDGGLRLERYRHEAGLYTASPALQFGDQWVADGNRGLYWRFSRDGLRVNWGMGISHDRQKSINAALAGIWANTGLNGYWVHRLDRRSSWGGNLQYTRQQKQGEDAGQHSAFGSLYYQNRWGDSLGDSRFRWTTRRNQALVSNGTNATGDELEWEQDWWQTLEPGAQNPTLRTTLGWAQDRSESDVQTYPTAGVTWQTWLASNWNLGTTLRYTSRTGNLSTSRGLSGSLQTEKSLARNWTMGASLLMNQAVVNTNSVSNGSALSVTRSDDKSLWLFVRFEEQWGQPYGFNLRGEQGAGSGRIAGTVFLDANRDGAQQADELGVAGVEVFLNQRQRTTTDSQGRYEFSTVPTGMQFISLRPESVPLPWGEGPRSRTTVEVPLRGTARAELPVVKVSE
jgi:hypothetical protein